MADLAEICVTCGLLESTIEGTRTCGYLVSNNRFPSKGVPCLFQAEPWVPRDPVEENPNPNRYTIEYWKAKALAHADEIDRMTDERDHWKRVAEWHKSKADTWLTAYQKSRVKNVGDYTRFFVRRPRMRRLITRLMRL